MARAAWGERGARRRDEEPRTTGAELPGRVGQILQLQRSAGNAAVARAVLARTFDKASYDAAMAERAKFAEVLYHVQDHRPSTGRGNFDVTYDPSGGRLIIHVRCNFKFLSGSAADYPDAEPEELTWDPADARQWKLDFMKVVTAKWSDKFTFHCTKTWWEDLAATVKIRFVEDVKDPHYDLNVTKIPEGEERGSSVTAPKKGGSKGRTKFDSQDLEPHDKRAGSQRPAVHEAGHMLGLGDEYPDKKDATKAVAHEALAKTEFGHGVPRKRDGRIMSNGEDIEPEHGVTFLEALRAVTKMQEWSFEAKLPTPVPSELMDGPMPQPPRDPLAPEPPEVAFA